MCFVEFGNSPTRIWIPIRLHARKLPHTLGKAGSVLKHTCEPHVTLCLGTHGGKRVAKEQVQSGEAAKECEKLTQK